MPAFRKILEGFREFKDTTFQQNPDLFKRLATKQSPKAMMIACCDSRVDPAIITHADPGDLFVVRNVANIVPPHTTPTGHHGTSAALEFAVFSLQVDYIIVLGHAGCGGIRALLTGDPDIGPGRDYIHDWIQIAQSARNRTLRLRPHHPMEEQQRFCEQENIKVSLDNLMTFPWIRERVLEDVLHLEGLYFDIAEGDLQRYVPERDVFESF